ncbi:lysophospholipase L1-like esterase [Mucilaginibacter yixingensis]|uniref:Lysophospholipase L1-like esterase n=1 Tax=Mucilaginibacter yixingensis TaxID=1295612 RepID=A0A2T5J506_9SPHI|nr:rhamnogalacturonan acetylesterase [Mucilaginibacter yixingensis]PTQ92704.1 lysophospholipase L1-like esterase [Mucilaginibacter yixingensis]
MKPAKKPLLKNLSALVLLSCAGLAFIPPKKHITIYLAGDSTMADKRVSAYPETGWGTRFNNFFDSTVTIVNRAQNGRSTRTFVTDGFWKQIADKMQADDYVLIQFGHNDEVPTKAAATTETEFKKNLETYVDEVRQKNAIPVLLTPVARRSFDANGVEQDTHKRYAELVREAAAEKKVMLVDMDKESMELLQKFGPERSKYLYNQLKPGENPNYPNGKTDNTHFSELGARKMAEIVLADLRKLSPELNSRVVTSNWGVK